MWSANRIWFTRRLSACNILYLFRWINIIIWKTLHVLARWRHAVSAVDVTRQCAIRCEKSLANMLSHRVIKLYVTRLFDGLSGHRAAHLLLCYQCDRFISNLQPARLDGWTALECNRRMPFAISGECSVIYALQYPNITTIDLQVTTKKLKMPLKFGRNTQWNVTVLRRSA